MILSFLVGILSGALIATKGSIGEALALAGQRTFTSSGLDSVMSITAIWSSWNLLIFIFLLSLGILIALLDATGAAQAYSVFAQKRVKSHKGAQMASLILSWFFFIDDYFSALTVGSVMRPLAHLYKVPAVKLAFLTTAMATPLTLLSPVSSWVGEIVLQLKQVGISAHDPSAIISADPYYIFLCSIPFIVYSIFMVTTAWYIVLRNISYGPMSAYEGNQEQECAHAYESARECTTSFGDFLLPIVVLMAGVFCGLLYTGDFYIFGGQANLLGALKAASVHQALFIGGLSSVFISTIYFMHKKLITMRQFVGCVKTGIQLMGPSILMLICAWSLGSILKQDLQTGVYIATLFTSVISIYFFPLVCFVFSGFIAWLIGSAWATIGLMFPMIIDMLQKLLHVAPGTTLEQLPLLLPVIGATLSGCIIGTQVSLLSDNPIMSSASTGAKHFEHVKTMAWYVVPPAVGTCVAYILIGLLIASYGVIYSLLCAELAGLFICVCLLELAHKLLAKR
jgi:Na+/H+ antiporter NhaC